MGHGTGFRGPLRYRNAGTALDEAPLCLIDQLSSIAGDTEHTRVQGYVNDFNRWEGPTADQAAPGVGGWIVTSVDTGAGGAESVDVRDSATYGVLRIQTNAADNDNTQIQFNGSTFKYVAGKRLWFAARVAPQTANDGEMFVGLAIEGDTDAINTLPTDGLFFEKAETATAWDFHARKNGTSTQKTALTGTIANDTFQELAFQVDADGNVLAYVDGTQVASIAAGDANLPNDEDLTLIFQVQTGNAATRYMDIDSVLVAQER